MSIKNTGQFPHTQHYYPSTINDLPIPSDIGDKSFIFVNGVKTPYIFTHTGWIVDTPDPIEITDTVGLKPNDVNLDASKNIGVNIENIPKVINDNLDISLTTHKNDIVGVNSKTLTDLFNNLETIKNIDFALSNGKTLADIVTELTTMSNTKTLADIVSKLDELKTEIDLIKNSDGIKKITDGIVNKNTAGTEIFTDANAGSVKLTGSIISDTDKSNFLPTKTVIDRTNPVLLRTVTTNDVLDNPVVDTVTGQETVGGSIVSTTAYKYSICAVNNHGSTIPITIATATPGGTNNALRLPISQVPNATGYVIFLSTDTQPKMVLQITEAQRAAGGVCTTAFEYATGGTSGAIDIGVIGTGSATNAACFTTMTAYTPEQVTETIVNTYNKSNLAIEIRINFDDYRVSPYLNYIVASRLVAGEGDWVIFQGTLGQISNARRRSVFTFSGTGGAGEEHTVLIYGLLGENISLPITAWYY